MQDELAKKNITWIEAGGDPWLTPYAPQQERRWPNLMYNQFSLCGRKMNLDILLAPMLGETWVLLN